MIKREKGAKASPSKDLIYGLPGSGKSSLGSTYPRPLFIDTEGSTSDLDTDRIRIHSYDEFIESMNYILNPKECLDIDTIVIDTADWLESMAINQILKEDQATSMADSKLYGFGAGDKRIDTFWRTKINPWFESVFLIL